MAVPGDSIWTPGFTGLVNVELLAAGGNGHIGQNPYTGCGGGGAAYASKRTIAVVMGVGILVRVGGRSGLGVPQESLFKDNFTCVADFGRDSAFEDPGAIGGQAASCVGDVKWSGGNGGGYPGDMLPGTGGGSSANRTGSGVNGSPAGLGGIIGNGGGNGGDGGAVDGDGSPGVNPGGGGGGGGFAATRGTSGGFGANGCVAIWLDTGVWPPPVGQVPIITFGAIPSGWIATSNVKKRKSVSMV